jgi:hypothetical protein
MNPDDPSSEDMLAQAVQFAANEALVGPRRCTVKVLHDGEHVAVIHHELSDGEAADILREAANELDPPTRTSPSDTSR